MAEGGRGKGVAYLSHDHQEDHGHDASTNANLVWSKQPEGVHLDAHAHRAVRKHHKVLSESRTVRPPPQHPTPSTMLVRCLNLSPDPYTVNNALVKIASLHALWLSSHGMTIPAGGAVGIFCEQTIFSERETGEGSDGRRCGRKPERYYTDTRTEREGQKEKGR